MICLLPDGALILPCLCAIMFHGVGCSRLKNVYIQQYVYVCEFYFTKMYAHICVFQLFFVSLQPI